jgi:phosphate-selective porin
VVPAADSRSREVSGSAFIQLRYTAFDEAEDQFALRRLKLMLGGDLNHDWQWFGQVFFKDGNDAPNDGRVYFQEGWVRFQRFRAVQFVAGQMKPTFSRERFTPDFELYTIERSLVVRTLVPNGDSRTRSRATSVSRSTERSSATFAMRLASSGVTAPIAPSTGSDRW